MFDVFCRSATTRNNIPNGEILKCGRGHPKKVLGVPDRACNLVCNDQNTMETPINPMEHQPSIPPRYCIYLLSLRIISTTNDIIVLLASQT